jgi:5'-3' exonuclease
MKTNPSATALNTPAPGYYPGRVLLIDGSNLLHRAWHGFRQDVFAPDGRNVRGVNGFSSMLANILANYRPEMVVVALESKDVQCWREFEYPEYKAHRRADADADKAQEAKQIKNQLPLVEEILMLMGIKCLWAAIQEADDVIAALTNRALHAGFTDVIVYSGDKDLLQLCQDPQVTVAQPRPGNEADRLWTHTSFYKVYGFSPAIWPDYKALVGDPSDNLKGVDGIGAVRAENLLQAFPYGLEQAVGWLVSSEQDATIEITAPQPGGKTYKLRANRYAQLMEPDILRRAIQVRKLATLRWDILEMFVVSDDLDIFSSTCSFPDLSVKSFWRERFQVGVDMRRHDLAVYMSQKLGFQYVSKRTQVLFDLADAIALAEPDTNQELQELITPVELPAENRHEESEENRGFSRDDNGQLVMF